MMQLFFVGNYICRILWTMDHSHNPYVAWTTTQIYQRECRKLALRSFVVRLQRTNSSRTNKTVHFVLSATERPLLWAELQLFTLTLYCSF